MDWILVTVSFVSADLDIVVGGRWRAGDLEMMLIAEIRGLPEI
jgi:hypothetical protein